MKYSTARKQQIEDTVGPEIKVASNHTVPPVCLNVLADRAWIMSWATDQPWIPIEQSVADEYRTVSALLSPSNAPRLNTADVVIFATTASLNLSVARMRFVSGFVEGSVAGDKRYRQAAGLTAIYLRNKVLQFDASYMWAEHRARLRFDALDDLVRHLDQPTVSRLGLTRPIAPITSEFDVWSSAYRKCVEDIKAGVQLSPTTSSFKKLSEATESMHRVVLTSLILTSLCAVTYDGGLCINVATEGSYSPAIHVKQEILGELERVYPQTFVQSDSGVLIARPLFDLSNFEAVGNRAKDSILPPTLRRRLTIGLVSQPTWFTYWFGRSGLRSAYPTLLVLAMAAPDFSAFFVDDPRRAAVMTTYRCGDNELPAPYSAGGALITQQQAAKLGRLVQRKANGQLVYPINPSSPYWIMSESEPADGVATPVRETVTAFCKARKLLPADFTDESTSLDEALASAIKSTIHKFETGVAVDFLVPVSEAALRQTTEGFTPITVQGKPMPGYYCRVSVASTDVGFIARVTYLFAITKGGKK